MKDLRPLTKTGYRSNDTRSLLLLITEWALPPLSQRILISLLVSLVYFAGFGRRTYGRAVSCCRL